MILEETKKCRRFLIVLLPTLPLYPILKYFKPCVFDGLEDAVPGVEAVVYLVGQGRSVRRCVSVNYKISPMSRAILIQGQNSQIIILRISKYAVSSSLPMSSGKWTTSPSMDLQ